MIGNKHKKLGKDEYKIHKAMLDAGVSVSKIDKMSNRSYTTIKRIRDSESYKDFIETGREYWKKYLAKKVGKKQETESEDPKPKSNGEVRVSSDLAPVVNQLNTVIAVLKAIEYKLDLVKGGE